MPLLGDGQIFERYQIIRELGNGVAGESYEAEDRVLQRKVTLKLIHPWATLSDPARRQFFREMQGISTLHHPYLATVLDYGEGEGYLYITRRYVSSGSLLGSSGRVWFRPPLSATSAFTYIHQLAQILQYIHQHGYVHGALTFANVLVLRGPNVEQEPDYAPFLLADIGLAHFARRFGNPRIAALPVSTAPEQIGKRVTPASDQFALAVLLYFWLAGRPPYLGTPDEVENLKLTEKITPLCTLNPGVTSEHDSIIQRALKASPEERYPSVLAFAESLLASLSVPTQTRPSFNGFGSEQLETPRVVLTRPLPALRKMPALRPASEPAEETPKTGQPGSEQNPSRPETGLDMTPVEALNVPVPETPLPGESTTPVEPTLTPQD
ncbi:MAG: serine/threonine protein kinase, partial [Ktedonobacteraceae bacterium]